MSLALLDTHAWVWLLNGSDRLGEKARAFIQQSLDQGVVTISAISPWEVAMLVSKERLTLDRDVGEWLVTACALPGLRVEPLSPEISVASTRLPGSLHSDPADRIIAATARHLGLTLVTDDRLLRAYGDAGHLKTLRAGI